MRFENKCKFVTYVLFVWQKIPANFEKKSGILYCMSFSFV